MDKSKGFFTEYNLSFSEAIKDLVDFDVASKKLDRDHRAFITRSSWEGKRYLTVICLGDERPVILFTIEECTVYEPTLSDFIANDWEISF